MSARRILMALILSAATLASAQPARTDPDPNRFAAEIKAFAEWDSKNAVPAEPVLFVGSSTIRMWRTRESFSDMPVVNRGFGGSHISDVIHYADQVVLPYKPKLVVFYAGDNDIASGKSAQRVADDYLKFARLVHDRLPTARILYIAIKPSRQRWSLWPEMCEANEMIRNLGKQDERLLFADLSTPLLGSDGMPKAGLFLADQLHLSPEGYAAWTEVLRPILTHAWGSERP